MPSLISGSVLLLLAATAAGAAEDAGRLVLTNDRLALALGKAEKGAIVSLVDRATGAEFVAPQAAPRLFALTLAPAGTPPGERFTLSSRDAATFASRVSARGGERIATLEYEGFGAHAVRVACTAALRDGDPLVRWRIRVDLPPALVLEETAFPLIVLKAPLGDDGADDAAVVGLTKGGVVRRPEAMKVGSRVSGRQPGSLAAQFATYYDARAGFYTAAFDGNGHPKEAWVGRTAEGIESGWRLFSYASGRFDPGFDLVQATFAAPEGATDWRHAADLYKAWALTQPWCARTYDRRTDIPAWMKAGPGMVRFNRAWLAQPERAEAWVADYWRKHFGDAPLITAYWGWEKVESWITPDYFPVYPSDEAFTRLVANLKRQGCHAFPWPSGYHWTLTFNKQEDGRFTWDDRERFDRMARPHAIHQRDGALYVGARSWLRGGDTACLCPGDPWTINWWNRDISLPLARRGADMIQVDQVVGGNFPFCYRPGHAHAPGPGPWITEVFERQLRTMLAECREVQPDAVVCFEEPNERFNHLVGIQDYRDCESSLEWASVFNYLYHEYLPTFQSNPRAGDTVAAAYCFANGQMPHLVPSLRMGPGPALENGGFEEWTGAAFAGWDKVGAYQGRVWNGRMFDDTEEKHAGAASLRLENAAESDVVQVSQNVPVGGDFAVGRRYRLGAWVKTERLAKPNVINLATFASGFAPTGAGGRIPFPEAGAGWQHGAAEFTVPEGSALLRIMIHVEGPAKVWVDDVTLEEVLPDGKTVPVGRPETPPDHALMRRWVELYHGEGRPYLLFGRMLHPPRLETATLTHRDRPVPAILHNAFRAPDGSEAVILVNATAARQVGTLHWKGRERRVELEPGGATLVR